MNKSSFVFLLVLLSTLGLNACVKQNPNSTTVSNNPTNGSSINNTNYQVMMQEQTERAAEYEASHPHNGGRR